MLNIDRHSDTPVFRRIGDAVRRGITSGTLVAGEKLPTQIKLAKDLGVNPTTVRNAYEILENQGLIVSKIGSGTYVCRDALQRLENHQGKRFGDIAVVMGVPRLADYPNDLQHIGVDILTGVEQELQRQFDRFVYVEKQSASAFLKDLPDDGAVLILPFATIDGSTFNALQERGIPTVSVWGSPRRLPIPHIAYDPHHATRLACEHLVNCGYKHIGFIGVMGGSQVDVGAKFIEFTSVLHRAGLDFPVRHIRDVCQWPGLAYEAIHDMIQSGDLPEAFFVDTDFKAMEVINALKKAGLKVPDDVGVISHNDIPEAAAFDPPLTTVRTPRREIGRQAARLLLEWSKDKPVPADIMINSELIIRGTTSMTCPAIPSSQSTPAKEWSE